MQGVIEWIAGLFVPKEAIGFESLGVSEGGWEVKATVGIDGEESTLADDLDDGFDAAKVFIQRNTADFHFDDLVAHVAVAFHFGLQGGEVFAGIVVPPRRVDPDFVVGVAVAVAIGEEAVEGFAGDFGDGIPDGHVDGADGDGALAVTTGLFIGHEGLPDAEGVEVFGGRVQQRQVDRQP